MGKSRPCEICMQPIQPERIEILPDTHLCCDHARKIAKFGGEFTITAVRERTSKAGSLKKNYGGVTPASGATTAPWNNSATNIWRNWSRGKILE